MVLTKSAMKELRKHLHFTQMRFHCKKRGGRTLHITTAANSKGEAVVKYLSGETDVIPASCGSFVIMSNDNSRLARLCQHWGKENGYYKVGKWGHERDQDRLSFHTAFVWDYTLVKEWGIIFGIFSHPVDGNATIFMLECPRVIFGKYSFAR